MTLSATTKQTKGIVRSSLCTEEKFFSSPPTSSLASAGNDPPSLWWTTHTHHTPRSFHISPVYSVYVLNTHPAPFSRSRHELSVNINATIQSDQENQKGEKAYIIIVYIYECVVQRKKEREEFSFSSERNGKTAAPKRISTPCSTTFNIIYLSPLLFPSRWQ